MVWFRCLLSLATLSVIMAEAVKHYDGYKVYRLIPKTEQQLHYLRELEQNVFELDFWRGPSYVNRPVDVMVPPHLNQTFNRIFWSRSIENRVMIEDVEKLAQEDKQYNPWAPSRPSRPGTRPITPAKPIKKPINPVLNTTRADIIAGYFDAYQTITSIYTFLNAIQSQYPSIASVYTLPTKSYQNRDLTLIKIGVNQASNTKPIIFFEGGIHAREWISPATVQCFAQVLVQGYDSNNADIVALLQKFDFYILPSTNPDGYAYTQTERLWRKTRKPYGSCYGADPNRNWAYQFGGEGSSSNQCSETYRGPNAFSEPETKAVSDYVLTLGTRVKAYKAVHSYGQYYLFPWGWTSALTSDHTALLSLGNTAANAIRAVYGTSYTVGTSTNVLYAAAGGADDWAYGGAGVKYSYTVELRDTGSYGFQLPASQIRASCEETSQGWIAFAKALATEVKG